MASIRQVIQQAQELLDASGIADPRLEAEVMVMHLLQLPRQDLFASRELEVSLQQQHDLNSMLQRRLTREPLAYIVGRREFYGLDLLVNLNVLIPRPETETLVELALSTASMMEDPHKLVIADVGTGCGAIAISLARHLPAARIYALDVSEQALEVAGCNVKVHTVADRVILRGGNLLEPLSESADLIVANPPYIPSGRIPTLQPEVQREPRVALDGGSDGLDCIRALLAQAPGKLKDRGAILLELDPEQVPDVEALAREYFPGAKTSVTKDLAGHDRVFCVNRQ